MPKKTFFNLDKARQLEIIEVSIEEFALNDYRNASVTEIVKRLGIAKGSFYRYFVNKRDLYQYLLSYVSEMNLDNVKSTFEHSINNFFELITQNLLMKIKFDLKYPLYSGFLYNTMLERNTEELGNVMLQAKTKLMVIIKNMLIEQQMKGIIRSDLDFDLIAYFVVQIQIGILDYISIKHDVDIREGMKSHKTIGSISDEELQRTVKGFGLLLRDGMIKYKSETADF